MFEQLLGLYGERLHVVAVRLGVSWNILLGKRAVKRVSHIQNPVPCYMISCYRGCYHMTGVGVGYGVRVLDRGACSVNQCFLELSCGSSCCGSLWAMGQKVSLGQ